MQRTCIHSVVDNMFFYTVAKGLFWLFQKTVWTHFINNLMYTVQHKQRQHKISRTQTHSSGDHSLSYTLISYTVTRRQQ